MQRGRQLVQALLQPTLKKFGAKLVSAKWYDETVEQLSRTRRSLREARGQIEALRTGLDTERVAHATSLRKMEELVARSDDQPLAVVVLTTISQVPQFASLLRSPRFLEKYRVLAVTYFDVDGTDLRSVIANKDVQLLDFRGAEQEGGAATYKMTAFNTVAIDAKMADLMELQGSEAETAKAAFALISEISWQSRARALAEETIAGYRAQVLILFEDNSERETGIWVDVARRVKVASVIIPFSIVDRAEQGEAHLNDPKYHPEASLLGRIVNRCFPKWVFRYRGRPLLGRPAAGVLAAEALGVVQPDPWTWNSSHVDAIAVESEAMEGVYLTNGVPQAQLHITGHPSDDILADALKRRDSIREDLLFEREKPILVCAFPPNMLGVGRSEPEFQDFNELAKRWIGAMKELQNWQIVIKPHPAMRPEDLANITSFGIRISKLDTAELIAVADLFVASVSSTIRWALARGLPVLNYDVYRYQYSDFQNERSVVNVENIEDFAAVLGRFDSDIEYRDHLIALAAEAAPRWGTLDGGSVDRILGLLDHVRKRLEARAR